MENNTIEVTGCDDCPLSNLYPHNCAMCVHPNRKRNKIMLIKSLFRTCPLKQSPITITLKTKNNGFSN